MVLITLLCMAMNIIRLGRNIMRLDAAAIPAPAIVTVPVAVEKLLAVSEFI